VLICDTAAAPQLRVCERSGCSLAGDFRAPVNREKLNEYRWFCLEHVREYNSRWNYYEGMGELEIEAHTRADVTWRRPTWPLGGRAKRQGAPAYDAMHDPYGLFEEMDILGARRRAQARSAAKQARNPLPPAEREALGVLELEWPVTMGDVKSRYKSLAKKHHPDANGGDRDAEELLKEINRAYSTLKGSSHLAKD
jgi:hypothetical protein